jgi:hypothetical protein
MSSIGKLIIISIFFFENWATKGEKTKTNCCTMNSFKIMHELLTWINELQN